MSPSTRSGRTWTWLGVLLLHAVLLWLLARSALPRREPTGPSTPPRVTLRVIPVAPEQAQTRPAMAATQVPHRRRPTSRSGREPASARTPDDPERNAAPEAITVRNADAAAPSQPAASQPERLLDLRLRPGFAAKPSARDEALADPRANSRATPEARMGASARRRWPAGRGEPGATGGAASIRTASAWSRGRRVHRSSIRIPASQART